MPERITQPVDRYKEYETIYILRADIDSDSAEKIAHRVTEVIDREKGKLVKVENWGRRRLAFEIKKQKRGVYTFVKFLGRDAIVAELERNLRMLDTVIRFQTVKTADNVKLADIQVDPEELKFAPLEAQSEDDKDDSREKQLGFIDSPDERKKRSEDDTDDVDLEPDLNPDLNFSNHRGE